MPKNRVLIAGGGIGGLALALSLHQVGVPFTVFESAKKMDPLGVGINLQSNAVRELQDMGIGEEDLSEFGLPVQEWALLGLNGREIHSEPRGRDAGYDWPQYSVHRGEFQMLLYHELVRRAGRHTVRLDSTATGYKINEDGSVTLSLQTRDGVPSEETGQLLIGADGIHSAIRAQMHPDQPQIHWGGTLMWRGTTWAKPLRSGASFIGLGNHHQRMVMYPISKPNPETGLALINWIAETVADTASDRQRNSWFRPVAIESFVHYFEDFRYDWFSAPELINGAKDAFENPMIDRDPIPTWVDGPVCLIGDAAHPMYPTGSNGASQAIMDARHLTRNFLDHGLTPKALSLFDETFCEALSDLALRNRGAGPFGLLQLVDSRCGGEFDDIEDVLPKAEREAFLARYKAAAGYERDSLNEAERLIGADEKVALS
ncbi:flavin-dependent oxidoreductase [Tropicibacter sp. R15_0]|uniref:flavin-dependent oxidoreductase n=1 Tax=Tropicibacter sp. R15_0 TaxID=2821101 RepID=UPI001AD9D18D|nr:flavin-dependent oxidoreductase [Tropicibacter sp. R15_0]MBO9467460.1 flavin-dependent oxidoreductase [Tropicibacter sp. R15_0]